MKIEDEFRVGVPVEEAWNVLLDVERIAPCMPGAQLQEVEGDEYRGIVKVKVGPITAQYKGAARIVEADEATRRLVIKAEGRDTRGQGNASATVTATLAPDSDGTRVSIDTDLNVTGKVAQFGRGVMADVSSKLLGQFVACLHETVLGTPADGGTETPSDDAPTAGASGTSGSSVGAPSASASAPPPAGSAAGVPAASSGSSPGRGEERGSGGVRKIDAPEAEAVDLMRAAGGAVMKRALPVVLVLGVVVAVLVWLLTK